MEYLKSTVNAAFLVLSVLCVFSVLGRYSQLPLQIHSTPLGMPTRFYVFAARKSRFLTQSPVKTLPVEAVSEQEKHQT